MQYMKLQQMQLKGELVWENIMENCGKQKGSWENRSQKKNMLAEKKMVRHDGK